VSLFVLILNNCNNNNNLQGPCWQRAVSSVSGWLALGLSMADWWPIVPVSLRGTSAPAYVCWWRWRREPA